MHRRTPLPVEARALLTAQSGAISTAQLRGLGLGKAVVTRMTREWTSVAIGVHLVGEPSWKGAAWAGLLKGGAGAVVGGAAACFLWGSLRDAPKRILVWSPHGSKEGFAVGDWSVVFRRGNRDGRGTPPRTSIEESLLDLARTATELDTVAALSRAFAQRLTMPERVLAPLDERRRLRHSGVIRALCADDGVESVLEWLFLRDVVRRHRLPEPARQVSTEAGRVDALYEEYGLVVELDGMRDHADWSKDMERDNEHIVTRDLRTLRYGFNAITKRRCSAASQLARGLRRGGWTGSPAPCPDCPEAWHPDPGGRTRPDRDAKR